MSINYMEPKTWGQEVEAIENAKEHHTATIRGYIPQNTEIVRKYSGRYGKGYVKLSHNDNSSRYAIITYYINN